ncbi:hypothetical protein BB559_002534 [Furculomyces boomerangus]|uniref:Uncharacterized protein n=2 Tax=Harpellales TaxID=61421 RepID=A0A2T9YUS2_9FUNG|nr:hypothetical protein BB559_002534 [Furculomyces boomerangus]PWA01303.1 hypothetical protein BB558_002611 [Smittium angustum]
MYTLINYNRLLLNKTLNNTLITLPNIKLKRPFSASTDASSTLAYPASFTTNEDMYVNPMSRTIKATFVTPENKEFDAIGLIGICGGKKNCTTCHIILEKHVYNNIDPPSEEEEDILDLSMGNQQNPIPGRSRLGCCVIVSKGLSDARITIPWSSMK